MKGKEIGAEESKEAISDGADKNPIPMVKKTIDGRGKIRYSEGEPKGKYKEEDYHVY